MRWYLAGGWLLACVLFGCGIYRRQVNRVRDYEQWVAFCDYLNQAIGFSLQPLPQAIQSYLPICRGGCRAVLDAYLQLLCQHADLTRARCQELINDPIINEFLYQLGRTGRETEQDKIVTVRQLLATKKEQAQHDLQSKASIMLKLLIIIGIAGGILWM